MYRFGSADEGPVPRIRGPVAVLAALALLPCCPAATAADSEASKLVVVIYPDESDGSPGIIAVNRALHTTFASESPHRIEVRNEYVDASRLQDTRFKQAQVTLLRQKYAGRKVDLLISGLSSGLDFVLMHRDELFPGVPVVFVAVDEREIKNRRLPPDVIGLPIRMDLSATLDLALRLHPSTRRVVVIAGSAPFDTQWEAEARRVFHAHEDRLEFSYLIGLPMNELLVRVANLPQESIIYYLHIHQDGAGKTFYPAAALDLLAARANAPIYGHVDTYVGRGTVGGHVFRFDEAGNNAARIGLRILSGEEPESIAISEVAQNTDMFDWRQLRRWGISETRLPPGSVVRFKDPSFWETYRWHIIGVVSLCVIQTLLIAGLLVQRVKRRRAEVAARESEARFEVMADAAPVLIWRSGADRLCTYFNRPWLDFTGRPLERELGDGWTEGVHPDDLARCREVYATCFDARVPFEMVYRLRRHDGEYRWVLGRGIPRFDPRGAFVGYIAACIDITERRRAEDGMRATERELKALTGRLIESQELERRRIARELHDDVNQGLALLAVEMDLLATAPPRSPAEAADSVREIAGRVKQLSSSIHDLSHQLHPSKLEHLGLVAAVRGLCKELGHGHNLDVKFTHYTELKEVPQDVALCLYRIVQEALRNVIKHSGSRHAAVELDGAEDAIFLRVTDYGAGFDPGAAGTNGGLGLVSMRERLHLVGGEIVIDSRPSGGTRIEVRVPARAPGRAEANWLAEPAST